MYHKGKVDSSWQVPSGSFIDASHQSKGSGTFPSTAAPRPPDPWKMVSHCFQLCFWWLLHSSWSHCFVSYRAIKTSFEELLVHFSGQWWQCILWTIEARCAYEYQWFVQCVAVMKGHLTGSWCHLFYTVLCGCPTLGDFMLLFII